VLSCNGFGFIGSGELGVFVGNGFTKVKVIDCVVSGFNFDFYILSSNSQYSFDTALNSGPAGFYICCNTASSNTFYQDSALHSTGNGVGDYSSGSNTFILFTSSHNGYDGFVVEGVAHDFFALDSANYNGNYGFENDGSLDTFFFNFCVGNTFGPSNPPGLCYS
jgi:hypothetical protein